MRKKIPLFRGFLLIAVILIFVLLPWKLTTLRFANQIYSPEESPSRWLAIVFGAGLRRDGSPSAVLADRVTTAVQLYKSGKVSKILMSGSIDSRYYDEAIAMKDLAIRQGVDPDDIYLDQAGTRTMETCLRARDNYNLDHVILISQEFHLPRALSICQAIGVDAIGVRADLRSYGSISPRFWQLREIPATFVAVWESLLLSVTDKGS